MNQSFMNRNFTIEDSEKLFNKFKILLNNIDSNLQDIKEGLEDSENHKQHFLDEYTTNIADIVKRLKIYYHDLVILDFKIAEYEDGKLGVDSLFNNILEPKPIKRNYI